MVTKRSREQLAVSLRGRAQRIHAALRPEVTGTYEELVDLLRSKLHPENQCLIHRMAFTKRVRIEDEDLVDLATDLHRLAMRAFLGREQRFVEEVLVDKFLSSSWKQQNYG